MLPRRHEAFTSVARLTVSERLPSAEPGEQASASDERRLQASKLEAIGRLTGGIAHDFNNLLTVILGCAELLQGNETLPPEDELAVAEILRAAERAAALTKRLLNFGRLQPQRLEDHGLNEVVESAAALLRRLLGESVELELDLDPSVATVRADRGQLEQVLMNLAINARDAMNGSGRVEIATRRLSSEESAATGLPVPQDCVLACLSVADDGDGIPTDEIEAIFDPLFTTKPVGEGSGMGLSIVHGIVEQHGGRICAVNRDGGGALFSVLLPTNDRPVPARVEDRADTAPPEESGVILFVEDEESVRRLIRLSLEAAGYMAIGCRNGVEALGIAEAIGLPIDLLLTDVVMPKMGGPELATCLRERHPELVVRFMSGYAGDHFEGTAFEDHAGTYLQKPFGSRALLDVVTEALER